MVKSAFVIWRLILLLKSLNEAKTNFALLLAKMATLPLGIGKSGPFQQKCKEYNLAENSKMGEN